MIQINTYLYIYTYVSSIYLHTHTHTHIYLCILFFRFFSIIDYYKILSIVLCALQEAPVGYLSYVYPCVYVYPTSLLFKTKLACASVPEFSIVW